MEHREVAGSSPEAPGANGLTINDLPDDMLINILSMIIENSHAPSMMDIENLLVVAKVCTRWQQLCMTPYVCKLRSLTIKSGDYIEISKNILPLFGKCLNNVQLYDLSISEAAQVRASIVSYCPNLTHLKIEMKDLDGSILDDLPHWPNLEFFSFWLLEKWRVKPCFYARNSAHNLPYVANNLKTVEIYCRSNSLEVAQFRASLIRCCPNLTRFKIATCVDRSFFDDNLIHLLPNLKFLSIFKTIVLNKHDAEGNIIGDVGDRTYNLSFEKLKYLEKLILSSFPLTRDSLYSMLECENLVSINMKYMTRIPEDFLESLVRTKQSTLRELHIFGDTLNDDIMRHISNCRQLQVLYIIQCKPLSDCSLLNLSSLKNLRSLKLLDGDFSERAALAFISNNTFKQMTHLSLITTLRDFTSTPQFIEIIKRNFPILKRLLFGTRFIDL